MSNSRVSGIVQLVRNVWLLAATLLPTAVLAQGIIIEPRPRIPIRRSFEVRQVRLEGRLIGQAAQMQLSQTFFNPSSFQIEVEYIFPVPPDSVVQEMVFLVDGREVPARVLTKEEARRIYEEIVRRKRDPALVEYFGYGLIRTSVFPIPAHGERTVTMGYTQLCRRSGDRVEFSYPLSTQKLTGKPIRHLTLDLRIESEQPIKNIYCPTHSVRIDREDDRHARVRMDEHDIVLDRDFRLIYSAGAGELGCTLLSYRPSEVEDGYFLLLASPEVRAAEAKAVAKTVVLVLDRSGSMSGKKIEQAKEALRFVLNNLRRGDLFNIVAYDSDIEVFKPELQRYTDKTRAEAIRFIDNIYAGGSTNIDAALRTALEMLRAEGIPSYVLFLTDGKPTAGEQRETALAENCRRANRVGARLFVFGVGYDVNARLLERLSGANRGTCVYVRPDEDVERAVSDFYAKLSAPVLTDLRIELADAGINRTYPRELSDLFAGGQLVWVGRYRRSGPATVRITGRVGEALRSYQFRAELAAAGHGSRYQFVEVLWAMRRIAEIIDELDLHGRNPELIEELVQLSRRYGILTPYTSFLADEGPRILPSRAAALDQLRRHLTITDGASGVEQRRMRQMMKAEAAPMAVMGFGYGRGAAPGQGTGADFEQLAREAAEGPGIGVAQTVRKVGSKTFYRRNGVWLDAEVSEEETKTARKITQFSDEYFELARSVPAELAGCLAFAEPVVVKIGGEVYRIVPEQQE